MTSIRAAYNIDSDDEDEEPTPSNIPKNASSHIQDIAKLKEQAADLLDPKWKEHRNKSLLMKMLELEEPAITPKMVDFLLQEGVIEVLLGFITQIGTNQPRPGPADARSDALKLSYRAVVLLSADEPSDALMSLLSKRAGLITRGIFDIFRDDSAGSFYHAHRLLECLLRYYPGDVYESITSGGRASARIGSMFRFVGYPPVGEMVTMLVALTPVSRMTHLYMSSSKHRWVFFEQMSQWNIMLRLTEVATKPDKICALDGYITTEQHSSSASIVLHELVEKLSLEDTGELLLQPFGYTKAIVDGLVDTSLSSESEVIRRTSMRLLCFLLRRVADSDIVCIMSPAVGAAPAPTYVPNRLFPLREKIIGNILGRVPGIVDALIASGYNQGCFDSPLLNPLPNTVGGGVDGASAAAVSDVDSRSDGTTTVAAAGAAAGGATTTTGNTTSTTVVSHMPSFSIPSAEAGPVKYSSYTVKHPFTALRALFVELLVLMVESDETTAELIYPELWRLFMIWTVKYAHNSIYHALFYRLMFAVLRQNKEPAQKTLFQKAKFATFLVEAFVPFPSTPSEVPPKGSPEEVANKCVARGLVMNCANAVRLQASISPPSAFLRCFLKSHQQWIEFLPKLLQATEMQQRFGLGVKVAEKPPATQPPSSIAGLIFPSEPKIEEVGGINAGSRFAKSLGFCDEVEWPIDSPSDAKKKNKKNKKKKLLKKKRGVKSPGGGGLSGSPSGSPGRRIRSSGDDYDDEEEEDDDADADGSSEAGGSSGSCSPYRRFSGEDDDIYFTSPAAAATGAASPGGRGWGSVNEVAVGLEGKLKLAFDDDEVTAAVAAAAAAKTVVSDLERDQKLEESRGADTVADGEVKEEEEDDDGDDASSRI